MDMHEGKGRQAESELSGCYGDSVMYRRCDVTSRQEVEGRFLLDKRAAKIILALGNSDLRSFTLSL